MPQKCKPLFSKTIGEVSWANACAHWGPLQGAFFLHHEARRSFFGEQEELSVTRTLLSTESFDVDGALAPDACRVRRNVR